MRCLSITLLIRWVSISLLIVPATLNGQILKDTNALNLIRSNVDHIYNFEFDKARIGYAEITKLYPDHPIVFLLRGIITYWENYPLLPSDPAHEFFEADMHESIKLSESKSDNEHEAEYLLANLCARGMLLMFYSDNDLITEVIPLTISSYKYLRMSFDFTSVCTDLNYFTGLYNYYREAYPKEYPVYQSLAMLFPNGGMEIGLKELQNSAVNGVVLGPESYYLLTWIYLNFENNYSASLVYSRHLHEKYPNNELYLATFLKNLLLLKEYDQAEEVIKKSPEEVMNRYLRTQMYFFKGIIQEKKYNNYEAASQNYMNGVDKLSFAGKYGNEYTAYCYFGMSRISEAKGEKQAAKTYRNQGNKIAEFKKISFDK